MVLQRDAVIRIRGWAETGETIGLTFQGKTYYTTTDGTGKWEIALLPLETGGPFDLLLQGNNRMTINNVLVWVCSGQSNMELPMRRVKPKYEYEKTLSLTIVPYAPLCRQSRRRL
jgi:sialate O-acetylesterase